MTGRWRRKQAQDNDGKGFVINCHGDYEICLNINRGRQGPGVRDKHGNHWQFEVTHQGVYIGEAPTLAGAKKVAAKHAREEKKDV